jgi:hypothetical protein
MSKVAVFDAPFCRPPTSLLGVNTMFDKKIVRVKKIDCALKKHSGYHSYINAEVCFISSDVALFGLPTQYF